MSTRALATAAPPASELDDSRRFAQSSTGTRTGRTARLVARGSSATACRTACSPPSCDAETREVYRSHVLHTEPDGSFSIVALVWRPGQATPIHDHVTWCVFTVVQGVEYEELFTLDEENGTLVEVGSSTNETGSVSGFAPPGDIHRVRNVGHETAISIHVYGTDVDRIGSSVAVLRPAGRL